MLKPLTSALFRGRALHPATLAVFCCGIALSLFLCYVLKVAESERNGYDFERRFESRAAAVKMSFDDAAEAMRAANLLFRSAERVTDAEYDKFTAPLLARHPYIQALVFYRFVDASERAAYEAERAAVWPGFTVRERKGSGFVPAPPRPRYLVLDKIAPLPRNHVAHGYDIWGFRPHRALAARSIDSGAATASGLIRLIEPRQHDGIVIALPVVVPGAAPGANAIGLTEVVIDVAALIRHNLERANFLKPTGLELVLSGQVDGSRTMREVVRYGAQTAAQPSVWARLVGAQPLSRSSRFIMYGQAWELRVRMLEPAAIHQGSTLMLVLGLALSALLAAYVQAWVSRAREVEALINERTADLKHTTETMRLYFRAIESSANSILLIDATRPGYPIEYVNPAFERMRGIASSEIVGRQLNELIADAPEQSAVHELQSAIHGCRATHTLLRLRRKDGSELMCDVYLAPVVDVSGRTEHFVLNEYDVTSAKAYEAQLEHRARYDTLTELPNRVLLTDRIERAMDAAARREQTVWVVALDLDHFKYVNDSLGHGAGDRLLQLVATRIAGAVAAGDTVARTGGDEFVLLLVERAHEGQVAATVNQILAALTQPFEEPGGQRIHIGCSAGVAAFPTDGRDVDTLIKHAEIAMYRAKDAGRNTVRFYLPGMNERAAERLALVSAMRQALVANEFELVYQAQIALDSDKMIGVEALIRWHHPELGLMRPDRFIGLAEESGMIVDIGTWVLRTACAQAARWQQEGRQPFRMAVNLSSHQFRDPGLAALIRSILIETGLSASCLELELTESVMMENVELAIATMHELKAMGVHLAIDDFGTGYSSLAYLKRFPVDVLKIDQSFVRDIEADASSAAMVSAIISMSHDLGMHVIAEGVETAQQLAFLRSRDCDEAQGYWYGRPMPAAQFEAMLEQQRLS